MNGAFKKRLVSVAGLLDKQGMNTLAVHIFHPIIRAFRLKRNKEWFGGNGGALCLDGPTFYLFGRMGLDTWYRDRNIGIWQDVRLVPVGDVLMEDPQVITDLPLPDTTYADIKIKTRLVNTTPGDTNGFREWKDRRYLFFTGSNTETFRTKKYKFHTGAIRTTPYPLTLLYGGRTVMGAQAFV